MFRSNGTSFWLNLLALSALARTAIAGATLKREREISPTATIASGTPAATCENPPSVTTGYPDYNSYCQCPPYTVDSPWYGNEFIGSVRCDYKCSPRDATQVSPRPETDSLESCMKACTGSYEKAKRGELEKNDDYWYCHGVNFKKGQLCEFIGSMGSLQFEEGGSDCLYIFGSDS
ncbi:hypothetical protein F4804DRAFT_303729 [Jackrogersella minutella]|nr:hypothetical protein F4804DRAFT_303729 [Jackrogersella minutella]